jgi:putative solute:sodium symporter small subunit
MDPHAPHHAPGDAGHHWRKTRRHTAVLLAVWFLATFFFIFFARELDQVHLFGWPISFYMAAQGMMLIYLAIVVVHVRRMKRIEQLVHSEQGHGE